MKIMTIGLCMALLISCTSAPLSVRYYLLHTPENKVLNTAVEVKPTSIKHDPLDALDAKKSIKTKPIAVLQLLDVADYLRQLSLVMQVGQHELHYSRQNVWAEKLQSSFYKALLQDLNANGQKIYVTSSSPNAKHAKAVINIKLEHFHATDSSSVVSSGQYWLSENNPQTSNIKQLVTSSHTFFFESQLKQDGYAHAVEQLRTLVLSLSKQIEKDITALPNN